MKSHSDLEQSKKLAEILPIESADMYYWRNGEHLVVGRFSKELQEGFESRGLDYTPSWSLAALLEVLPKFIEYFNVLRIDISNKDFSVWYEDLSSGCVNETLPDVTMESPIDACVEMIVKLKGMNLI